MRSIPEYWVWAYSWPAKWRRWRVSWDECPGQIEAALCLPNCTPATPPPPGLQTQGFLCEFIMLPPQHVQGSLVPMCNVSIKGGASKTHINTQKFRGSRIIFRQTSLFSALSPNCSVCSCVRLRCFTTRLHCQSACLIGCTPVRTTTLSSSSWRSDLSSAEERTLSETLNATQKFTDFCQCLWCRGICRRKGCFVRSSLTK